MDDRQSRLLMGMALVLAVLIGLLVFLEAPDGEDEHGHAHTFERLLDGLEGASVDRLTLASSSGLVDLVRAEDGWLIRAPLEGPADTARVEALVTSLTTTDVGEPLVLQDEPVGVGLADNASVRVTLTTRAGAAQSFMVGTDSPVGGGTYIIDPSGDIRLTRLAISAAVRTGVDELRSRAVARFAASAVTGVGISGAARTLMLRRVESDWWVEEYGHEVDGRRAEVPTGRHRAAADRIEADLGDRAIYAGRSTLSGAK